MEKSLPLKKRVLLLSALFFVLAPFSTLIPCLKLGVPKLYPEILSMSMDTLPFIAYVLALVAYEYVKGDKRRSKMLLLEAILLNVLVLVFKYLFDRPRPLPAATPGYPSGHSARAAWLALKVWKKSKTIGVLVWLYAIAVMWSRVELCKHYPLDIIGGVLLAVIVDEVLGG